VEDGGDGWLVSAVVARVVCAASARIRRGMLSGGQRYGQRGDGVVAQEDGRGDHVDNSGRRRRSTASHGCRSG
jgi:hypothetical protein